MRPRGSSKDPRAAAAGGRPGAAGSRQGAADAGGRRSAVLWGGLGAAIVGHWFAALTAPLPALRRPLGVLDRIDDRSAVALTFDDGPHPEGTPAVLDLLDAAQATATFFLTGEQAERRPDLAREIVRRGHAVGNHGYRHRFLPFLLPGQVSADLDQGAAAIAATTGRRPRLYRPPYGVFSTAALIAVRRRGWQPVLWSQAGADWRPGVTAEDIVSRVTTQLAGGQIILLHDSGRYGAAGMGSPTVQALPRILEAIEARGLRTIRLEDAAAPATSAAPASPSPEAPPAAAG